MRRLFLAIALTIAGLAPHAVLAAGKHAFVVGIDTYDRLGPDKQLLHARNDSRSIAAALKDLDYEVTAATDLGRYGFNEAWQGFLDTISAGDTVMLFFSGHGVQVGGLNYLLPRDIPRISPSRQELLTRESISVSELLQDLASRKPRVSVVILDACRDNPFAAAGTRSADTPAGLAGNTRMPKGTFIMYAAAPGQAAFDRLPPPPGTAATSYRDPEQHSLFTRRLLPLLKAKGLTIQEMAERVRSEVIDLARSRGEDQRPTSFHDIEGKFCIAGCEGGGVAATTPAILTPPPAGAPPQTEAERAYERVRDTRSVTVLEAYAQQFPGTVYAAMARERIADLQRVAAAPATGFGTTTVTPWNTPNAVPQQPAAILPNVPAPRPDQATPPRDRGPDIQVQVPPPAFSLPGLAPTQQTPANAAAPRQVASAEPARLPAIGPLPVVRNIQVAESRKLRLASAYPKSIHALGLDPDGPGGLIKSLTGGKIEITTFAAGEIVPAFGVLDAVAKGVVDLGWAPANFFIGKAEEFTILGGGTPFGLSADRHLAWLEGEGRSLHRDTWARHGVVALPCTITGALSAGWYRKPIRSVDDLKGLKIRIGGQPGKAIQKLGAVIQLLPAGEIYPALERGLIDAAVWAQPHLDRTMGFEKITKYYHFPGWQQPVQVVDLIVNKAVWDAFPADVRQLFEETCRGWLHKTYAGIGGKPEQDAIAQFKSAGVTVGPLPEPVLAALRRASDEVLAEEAAKSADFKRVLESYRRAR